MLLGIPDSFVVEINDGQQYRRNKHNIIFSPPRGNDSAIGGTTGNQHAAEEQGGTENRTDRLRPRPALKFPKLPMQAMLHSDFEM